MQPLNKLVLGLENWAFGHRRLLLAVLAAVTLVMAGFATQLRMDAGFEKQLPTGHEYIKTFLQYRSELFNANRLIVVVRARHGTDLDQAGADAAL